MRCEACDTTIINYVYRWQDTVIGINACVKHATEVKAALDKVQAEMARAKAQEGWC